MSYCRRAVGLVLLSVAAACGGDGQTPTQPSPAPQTTPPVPTFYAITGTVSSAAGGVIVNATARVVDGPNAGLTSTTDANGRYTLGGLTFAGFSVAVSANGYLESSRGIPLTAGQATTTANFSLLPATPWSQSGTGNNVFAMPTYFARVRIVGIYNGRSSNFIIRIGGRLVVNELLGTSWGQTVYDGVHLTSGGTVEITNSSGVAWSFTEAR